MLGIGLLLGFALTAAAGISATAGWLLIAYALVIAGIAFQALVAIPWLLRAMRSPDASAPINRRMPALIATGFALVFAAIVFVMVLKPAL